MIFDISDDTYDEFMGRYSVRLAPLFADFAEVSEGQRVLDVGAGTGALAATLARRVGDANVAAAEPSPRFVEGMRARLPRVDVQEAPAEKLPWPDATFDAALAQLVISFAGDAPAAVQEMARVVRPGGVVALCMWNEDGLDLAPPLQAARKEVAPDAPPPRVLPYRGEGELLGLLEGAGLEEPRSALLEVEALYESFDEFWSTAIGGVGPDGAWLNSLDAGSRAAAGAAAYEQLGSPMGPFSLGGRAWAVRATRA